MEVGLGLANIVLDEDRAPPQRGTAHQFSARVCCGQTAGWIKICHWVYGGRHRPRPHCVRWGRNPPPRKGAQQPHPPLFGPCLWPNGRPSQLLLSTAHARVSSGMHGYVLSPKNCPFALGDLDSSTVRFRERPPEPITKQQRASRSVQLFLHSSPQSVDRYFTPGRPHSPHNVP